MRVIAAVLALIAVILMIVAIAGMVTGRPGDRAGVFIRVGALLCFVAARGAQCRRALISSAAATRSPPNVPA